jgi:hypothetical protein
MSGAGQDKTPTSGSKKQSFQTYEGQARLLAALIASHNIRLDYKGECILF